MGRSDVDKTVSADRLREFSRSVLKDLAALSRMLEGDVFETDVRRIGAEQELFLVDAAGQPASVGPAVLDKVDDPRLTTELGRFNLELNLDPQVFAGDCFARMESQLVRLVERVGAAAATEDAAVVLIGILPTLRLSHLDLDHMTPVPRYHALDEAMARVRGGRPYELYIRGRDELRLVHENVMFEACNTSFQVHLQVAPAEFARFYNVAQVVTAPVLAVAANSPLLLGRQLWRETRIALFEQSIDTRPRTGHLRQEPRRVSFGARWVDESVVEIFEEDISRFSAILAGDVDEDALEVLAAGGVPKLRALALHNGTIYRWNRPCYGMSGGRPHLRIENRVIPSGPTPLDEMANAAFWLGLMMGMTQATEDVRREFEFSDARENFVIAARLGLGANLVWGRGQQRVPVRDLVTSELLPLARAGLESVDVDTDDIDRLLGVIGERVDSGRGGARWQIASLEQLKGGLPESQALCGVVRGALARQREGRPVHTWSVASLDEAGTVSQAPKRVEQLMTTDLFTVHEEEVVDIVASVMKWRHIRRVPVEDGHGRLVGLVTYRALLQVLSEHRRDEAIPVAAIMRREVVSVKPSCTALDAVRLMREKGIGCLPVVDGEHRLVGILTEHDFIELAWPLLEAELERRDPAEGETNGGD